MFAARYYAARYFAPRYFPKVGAEGFPVVADGVVLPPPLAHEVIVDLISSVIASIPRSIE